MKDERKRKEELIKELWELRRRVSSLEKLEAEHKRVKNALRSVEEEKAVILDSISELISYQDADMRVIWTSHSVMDALEKPPGKIRGMHCCEVWHGRKDICEDCPSRKAIKTGKPQKIECTYPDGRSWLTRSYPVFDKDGKVEGTVKATLETTALKQAEKALQESEARMLAIFEAADDIAFVITQPSGRDAKILDFSPGAEGIFGYSRDEIIGRPVSLLHLPVEGDVASIEDMRKMRAEFKGEVVLVRKSGERFPALFTTYPIPDAEGNSKAYLNVTIDITERKRAEDELRELMEKYRTLVQISPEAVTASDLEGNITEVSRRTLELHGFKNADEMIGGSSLEAVAPEDRERAVRNIQKTLEQGFVRNLEYKLLRKDGSTFDGELSASLIKDAHGSPKGFIATVRDITERKKAEDELKRHRGQLEELVEDKTAELKAVAEKLRKDIARRRAAESELRIKDNAIDTSISAFALTDLDGKPTYANPSFVRMWGFDDQIEVVGRPAVEFFWDREKIEEAIEAIRYSGSWKGELAAKRKDGSKFFVHVSASMVTNEDGIPICMMGSFDDITERKLAERAIRESEHKLAGIINAVTDSITMIDEQYNVVWANNVAKEQFGPYLVGRKCYEAYHGRDQVCGNCIASKSFEDGQVHEEFEEVTRPDGKTMNLWQTSSVAAFHDDGRPKMVVEVSRDITEKKLAEEATRESEARYRLLADNVTDIIWTTDNKLKYTYMSPSVEAVTGYTPEEAMNSKMGDTMTPESLKLALKTIEEETILERKGKMDINRTRAMELERICKDGSRIWVESRMSILRDRDGKAIGVMGVSRDITERKQAEEALKESEQRYRMLFQTHPDSILLAGLDGTIMDCNNTFEMYSGAKRERLIGASITRLISLITDEDESKYTEIFSRLAGGEIQDPIEVKVIRKGGEPRWVLLYPALLSKDGEGYAIQVIIRSITDEKLAQQSQQTGGKA